jgi:hypothetical protein
MRSRMTSIALLAGILGIGVGVSAVLASGPSGPGPAAYDVRVDAGVQPRASAGTIAEKALSRLAAMEDMADNRGLARGKARKVLSVQATTGDKLPSAVDVEFETDRIVWLVRAEGTFVATRGRTKLHSFSTGFFVIDDQSRKVLAMGMP